MNTISSCLIVKNGGDHFKDLINQLLRFSDEVIIVDTGSTDNTIDIIESFPYPEVRRFQFDWIDDFAAARNYSFQQATKDWIFWCDADDSISEKLQETLNKLKYTDLGRYTSVSLNYEFAKAYYVPRRRLLKRSANPIWYEPIHEYVMTEPDIVLFQDDPEKFGAILHTHRDGAHTSRNIRIFIHQICIGNELSVRGKYYFASEIESRFPDLYKRLTIPILDEVSQFDCWNIMKSLYYIYQKEEKLGEWIELINEFLNKGEGRYLRGDVLYMYADTQRFVTKLMSQDEFLENLQICFDMYLSGGFLDYGEDKTLSKVYPGLILGDHYRAQGLNEKAEEYYRVALGYALNADLRKQLTERLGIN